MRWWLNRVLVLSCCCLTFAVLTEVAEECVIELECRECVPENMPLVTSHRAAGGRVRAKQGDEVLFSCGRGKFLEYPLLSTVTGRCWGGRYLVQQTARHLLDLGCQENVFEDVLHHVDHCSSPLQGRAYETASQRSPRHLALLCFDADRGVATRAYASNAPIALPAHTETAHSPLSLLGNFNHMFDAKTRADAERLYSDDASTNKRLDELLKHENHNFAGQTLTAGRLLSPLYFDDQNARVAEFASNKVALWGSVAAGNWRHLQEDVAALLRRNSTLHVHAGTLDVMSVRSESGKRAELYLSAGRRFPVPRYLWTVVSGGGRAVALVLLNDPFVAVSEVRDAVFCESQCGRLRWARKLAAARRYEAPVYGLVFCCELAALASRAPAAAAAGNAPRGVEGLLTDI